jgi:hypothetical protein
MRTRRDEDVTTWLPVELDVEPNLINGDVAKTTYLG